MFNLCCTKITGYPRSPLNLEISVYITEWFSNLSLHGFSFSGFKVPLNSFQYWRERILILPLGLWNYLHISAKLIKINLRIQLLKTILIRVVGLQTVCCSIVVIAFTRHSLKLLSFSRSFHYKASSNLYLHVKGTALFPTLFDAF